MGYTSRTMHSERHEWIIPAAEPWGSDSAEVGKAWSAAQRGYRKMHGMPEGAALSDDALRFHVADDQIIIAFTIEKEVKS